MGSPFVRVGHCLSLSLLGVRIAGAGVEGRFMHPLASIREVGRV